MAQVPANVLISDLPPGTTPVTGLEIIEAIQTTNGVGNSVQFSLAQVVTSVLGTLPTSGNTGQILSKSGLNNFSAVWSNLSSLLVASTAITLSGSTTVSISLSTVAGLSVLGVAGAAQAVPAAIVGAAAQALVVNDAGNAVAFGPLNLGSAAAISGVLPVTNGGTNTSSLTANGVVYGNGAATVGITPAGATGQLLTAQGASPPIMAYGGHTLLNVLQANAVPSIQDTTSFTSVFNNYMIYIDNMIANNITASFQMTLQSGGVFQTTNYVNLVGGATTYIDLTTGINLGTSATSAMSGPCWISNINSTTALKTLRGLMLGITSAGALQGFNPGGMWTTSPSVISGFKIAVNSGTFTATVSVFGIKSS